MTKNIIVLMDGTWDSLTQTSEQTNVAKLNNILINDNAQQLIYYDDGVGADASGINKLIDGVTGLGINDKIIQGYQFIMQNFNDTDIIYLFGFSRGAYTVRYIADFIAYMGLLKLINNESLTQQFARINDYFNQYQQIKNTNSANIDLNIAKVCTITMVGVWDTVGELGVPLPILNKLNNKLYAFSDNTLHDNVLFGYQALAIDEKRSGFMPCLWNARANIKQVWFTGSHSDIGGGYSDSGLSDISLTWMVDIARNKHGILIDETKLANLSPNPLAQIHDPTLTFPYNLLASTLRNIPEGSLIKDSVKVRLDNKTLNYNPTNLPKSFQLIS